MRLNLQTKIWLTVTSIVMMFAFFILFYLPAQQEKHLLKNFNQQVQSLANTVSLGVKIAITEQNFEGVQTAMDFVKEEPHLKFVSIIQEDSVRDEQGALRIDKKIFKTYPENMDVDIHQESSENLVVKRSNFQTSMMNGSIMLGFSTDEIADSKKDIKITSLIVTAIVLLIGMIAGLLLARNISVPVQALRDASYQVGKGDLTQRVGHISNDEIGELGQAFNKMVGALDHARQEIKKANASLEEKNTELNSTLEHLQETQAQLIQSEKMASLGQLTAGIAHEIQNPLNFVNNFSEINTELITEMIEEIEKGNYDDVKAIAQDIAGNESKINHHGKRADGIVKGMLQHSRTSSGQKEPTDINVLADEYLRLAYHGLRAKDKSFNATLKTDFDESIGKLNVIAQDIGRVILNLITNAFYVVAEKNTFVKSEGNSSSYSPTVSVSTKRNGNLVEICVEDNGNGIPQTVLDKIFQPFFTTKPTGQGTGLGLSLSYDIIKAHNGTLNVETKEGEGTKFKIQLPI